MRDQRPVTKTNAACARAGAPEVLRAAVQVGHHAEHDGQEGVVAPPRRLQHAHNVQRALLPLRMAETILRICW